MLFWTYYKEIFEERDFAMLTRVEEGELIKWVRDEYVLVVDFKEIEEIVKGNGEPKVKVVVTQKGTRLYTLEYDRLLTEEEKSMLGEYGRTISLWLDKNKMTIVAHTDNVRKLYRKLRKLRRQKNDSG